jgi:hypothetical protein
MRLETDLRTRSLRSLASSAQPNINLVIDLNVQVYPECESKALR